MSNVAKFKDSMPALSDVDVEQLVMTGDISKLPPKARVEYYQRYCEAFGMAWISQPIMFYKGPGGSLSPYVRRAGAEQIRENKNMSIRLTNSSLEDGIYTVTAEARLPNGRTDQDIGVVDISGLRGEAKANAIKKCTTQAKRRVTLSLGGLGIPDESEVADIPNARRVSFDEAMNSNWDKPVIQHDAETGEVHEQPAVKPTQTPFWDRPSYTIPAKDSELPTWVNRLCRAIGDAPDLHALCKLRDDNQGTLDRLVIDNDKELFRRYEQSLEVRKGMLESEDAA